MTKKEKKLNEKTLFEILEHEKTIDWDLESDTTEYHRALWDAYPIHDIVERIETNDISIQRLEKKLDLLIGLLSQTEVKVSIGAYLKLKVKEK